MRAGLKPLLCIFVVIGTLSSVGWTQQAEKSSSLEYPTATVREAQDIVVDGARETWQLQWRTSPKPYCEPSANALTCPCVGFAYGEAGNLSIVRLRGNVEIDRLELTPFFTELSGVAAIQRWPADESKDFDNLKRDDFVTLVKNRPTVQVMHFADYDHDGAATEFYLQTEAAPCGKSVGIVVGLSKTNPRLHAFGNTSGPASPLYLQKREWEALREATGPVDILDWACADHGADTETRLKLSWTRDGIYGVRQEYACSPDPRARRLLSEKPL